jgi:hypothetical protein
VWTRYGFHEASSLRAAAAVPGVTPPCAIADADVEGGEPCVDAKARLFDALGVMRTFIVGKVLLVVFGVIGPVERKED